MHIRRRLSKKILDQQLILAQLISKFSVTCKYLVTDAALVLFTLLSIRHNTFRACDNFEVLILCWFIRPITNVNVMHASFV